MCSIDLSVDPEEYYRALNTYDFNCNGTLPAHFPRILRPALNLPQGPQSSAGAHGNAASNGNAGR